MRRFVYSSLKVLHLMGLVLFLGSIFGHIVAGSLGGGPVSGDRFLAAREPIPTHHILRHSQSAICLGSIM